MKTHSSHLTFVLEGNQGRLDYIDIRSIKIKGAFLSHQLVLATSVEEFQFAGISENYAKAMCLDIETNIKRFLTQGLQDSVTSNRIIEGIRQFLDEPRYLSRSDVYAWQSQLEDILSLIYHPYRFNLTLPTTIERSIEQIYEINLPKGSILADRNEAFIKNAIKGQGDLFLKLEKYPLTAEQVRAVVTDEDRNLLVAAAGSGKTSTLIAKIAYLLTSKSARPGEILVLAYNKDAQTELERRITDLAGKINVPVKGVISRTFHGLGVEIISATTGKKPSVAAIATAGRLRSLARLNDLVESLKSNNPEFADNWRTFQLFAKHSSVDQFGFQNLQEYNDYLVEMGAVWRTTPQGRRPVIAAIDGNEFKSFEEVKIANWLVTNGVDYQYEVPYKFDTATQQHRQYAPDFYYPKAQVYHEHFALDPKGSPPAYLGKRYLEGVQWKRALHKENKTKLIETTSAQFHDGSIFNILKAQLLKHGVEFAPLTEEQIDARIQSAFDPESDIEIFSAILKHFKANNARLDQLKEKAQSLPDQFRVRLFLSLFESFFTEYQRCLGADIDFEDQINQACRYLENRTYVHPYKYVLVDEAQDLSQDRKRMLLALLGQEKTAKLFAVGDDWQSIYRFSGADIDIMTRFQDHFGPTARNYLNQSYRSYQGIVDVAAVFIQRNPTQFKKTVKAHADLPGDLVIINTYSSEASRENLIETRLQQLNQKAIDKNRRFTVFLLGRYHNLKPPKMAQYIQTYKAIDLDFKTVHAAKGLEADYTLILDVNSGRYGFPSKIVDDPLLHLVMPQAEEFRDAEERRLFYVALTRAKIAVLIFTEESKVSPFIKELSDIPRVKAPESLRRLNKCPQCSTGEIRLRKGKYGAFWGCDKYPKCQFSSPAVCPQCKNGKMVVRSALGQDFLGCTNYPECRFTGDINSKVIVFRRT